MRAGSWLLPLVVLIASPALAMPSGPVVSVGGVLTPSRFLDDAQTTSVDGFLGPVARIGYEFGNRFNHEFSFQLSRAGTVGHDAALPQVPIDLSLLTLAGGYNFTVDFAGKEGWGGFTPFLGTGLYLGQVTVNGQANALGQTAFASKSGLFLELHASVGLRYTLSSGLGFRAELNYTTYGGFIGWQPCLSVAYRL